MSQAIEQEQQAPEITCFHCGELKEESEMEPLSWGDLSNCCKDCWQDHERVMAEHLEKQVGGGWRGMAEEEAEEAERRARMKEEKKAEEKAVEQKDYGNLWLVK